MNQWGICPSESGQKSPISEKCFHFLLLLLSFKASSLLLFFCCCRFWGIPSTSLKKQFNNCASSQAPANYKTGTKHVQEREKLTSLIQALHIEVCNWLMQNKNEEVMPCILETSAVIASSHGPKLLLQKLRNIMTLLASRVFLTVTSNQSQTWS